MPEKNSQENILSSWKEIAAYLDCHVRTCHRWEKLYSLPVYRIDPSKKSRVYAYQYEIDQWRKERFQSEMNHDSPKKKSELRSRYFYLIFAVPILVTASLFYLLVFRKTQHLQPYDFSIEQSSLVITNETGDKLWKYETGMDNLIDEEKYRERFQHKIRIKNESESLPLLMIKDINQDGENEVLFTPKSRDNIDEGIVICFNSQGKQLWKCQTGKKLRFGSTEYSQDFKISGFDLFDINNDGIDEILIISFQLYYFPTQLLLLDHTGQKLGEYWNSGRLTNYEIVDLNQDNQQELLITGMNNEYNKAALIIFNPSDISGSSPQQSKEYKFSRYSSGSELFYILLPRTDVDSVDFSRESSNLIDIFKNKRISVQVRISRILFEFDFSLAIKEIHPSDIFRRKHQQLKDQGKIDSELDDEYFERLKEGLLYYDGKQWVSHPAMRNPWN